MQKTKPYELLKFHNLLMSNAPEGYTPWYFPVVKHNKAPDGYAISLKAPKEETNKGNWKAPWARLTLQEAINRLNHGENVGLAARAEDPLVIIDIDDYSFINQMPDTLIVTSRKRTGVHGFCWKKPDDNRLPINIPTEHGEVRSSDQYVVAAGSYCQTSTADIDKEDIDQTLKTAIKQDPLLGVYTLRTEKPPIEIGYDELPQFFKDRKAEVEKQPKVVTTYQYKPIAGKGKRSALFELRMEDIVPISPGKREPHPLHSSDTGMNFSVSEGLGHCWRHLVSLNAIQFLAVKSGYCGCLDAGTGHSGSGAGESKIKGDYGAIFYAWLQAKKDRDER